MRFLDKEIREGRKEVGKREGVDIQSCAMRKEGGGRTLNECSDWP